MFGSRLRDLASSWKPSSRHRRILRSIMLPPISQPSMSYSDCRRNLSVTWDFRQNELRAHQPGMHSRLVGCPSNMFRDMCKRAHPITSRPKMLPGRDRNGNLKRALSLWRSDHLSSTLAGALESNQNLSTGEILNLPCTQRESRVENC